MKYFYDIVFLAYAIAYVPVLLWKGKFHRRFPERFGAFDAGTRSALASFERPFWIHAVSVGEVAAAKPIVERLRGEYPSRGIVVSTSTRTGYALARDMYVKGGIPVIYAPLDVSVVTDRVAEAVRPSLYGMMETELWPNLIRSLSDRGVPVVLLNGRISDRSYGYYRAAAPFMRGALSRISAFCMRSETDAERIRSIGAEPAKVRCTGNVKFDVLPGEGRARSTEEIAAEARRKLGIADGATLFVAGSTHPGEEEIVLEVYLDLVRRSRDVRLLIAPRHIERTAAIESLLKRRSLKAARVSRIHGQGAPDTKGDQPVLILDSIGELKDIFACATIVFMGGSLVKKGGHNLIEPAVHGRPIVFGPHMFNFTDMAGLFIRERAAVRVSGPQELGAAVGRLLADAKEREALGRNARRIVESNAGATERTMDEIRKVLAASPSASGGKV